MRKLLIGIFALGLVIAFAAPASALDIKVSGEYKVEGWMIDNQKLDSAGTNDEFYTQRLRVATTFAVSPRLMVNTRFDVMEGVWGGHKTVYGENGYSHYGYSGTGTGTTAVAGPEPGHTHAYTYSDAAFNRDMDTNIQFDLVNMRFITKCGIFDVGYQIDGVYGTTFGDTEWNIPKISWILPKGKFTSIFQIKKYNEGDWSGLDRRDVPTPLYGGVLRSDADEDRYMWIGMYTEKNWQAGLLLQYHRAAQESMGMAAFSQLGAEYFSNKKNLFLVTPYFKGTFGNLYLEGQIYWFADGELEWQDNSTDAVNARNYGDRGWGGDLDLEGFTAYVMGKYNIGAGYAGALFAYAQGDDPYEKDTLGGLLDGGEEWNPMLILWNKDLVKWGGRMGNIATNHTTGKAMTNAMLFQIFGGYKVNEKLDLFGAFAWAQADETLNYVDDEIGYELDVKATYKIFDNLEYEVAFGYFWAGDWYKGVVEPGQAGPEIDDNYLLFHKLSLKF